MHTSNYGNVIFHHNGGYDGDVIIVQRTEGEEDKEVKVPFNLLEEIVAEKKRLEKIEELEKMSTEELLNLK